MFYYIFLQYNFEIFNELFECKKIENNVELWVKMFKKLNIMDKSYIVVIFMGFYFYWLVFFYKFFGQNSLEDVYFVVKDYINMKFL